MYKIFFFRWLLETVLVPDVFFAFLLGKSEEKEGFFFLGFQGDQKMEMDFLAPRENMEELLIRTWRKTNFALKKVTAVKFDVW